MRADALQCAGTVVIVLLVKACGPSSDSVSHWSEACTSDRDCGELSCMCGSCTRGCASDVSCRQDPAGACYDMSSPLLVERCGGLQPQVFVGVCLRSCSDDADCELDAECAQGACVPRARGTVQLPGAGATVPSAGSGALGPAGTRSDQTHGATPAAGSGARGVTAGTTGAVESGRATDAGVRLMPPHDASVAVGPRCFEPKRVVVLGDSYVDWPVMLVGRLEQRAVAAGLLGSGEHLRSYARAGATLDTPPNGGDVPAQWRSAASDDAGIDWVIMDGAGNDVLAGPPACMQDDAASIVECTALAQRLTATARALLSEIKAAGVRNLLYFWYPDVPAGGHAILGALIAAARGVCDELGDERFSCEIVDPRPAFAGHPEYFDEGIHPNEAGSAVLADVVWAALSALCAAGGS